ncbi:MAG: aldo/keto reductase [Bryobacteraceae bacterium]
MKTSRREFLEKRGNDGNCICIQSDSAGRNDALPTRTLGKTGAQVSILAMGAGSRFLMYKDEEEALEAAKKALDLGITYIDSSDDYGQNHLSERRIGKALKGRRKEVFLATKLSNRNGAESGRVVEDSLRALQVDQVDLIHIHSLTTESELARIEAKGGVLEQLMKLRDEKLMRFVGIASHTDPTVLRLARERHDFNCTHRNEKREERFGSEFPYDDKLRKYRIARNSPQERGCHCNEGVCGGSTLEACRTGETAAILAFTSSSDRGCGNAEARVHYSKQTVREELPTAFEK